MRRPSSEQDCASRHASDAHSDEDEEGVDVPEERVQGVEDDHEGSGAADEEGDPVAEDDDVAESARACTYYSILL